MTTTAVTNSTATATATDATTASSTTTSTAAEATSSEVTSGGFGFVKRTNSNDEPAGYLVIGKWSWSAAELHNINVDLHFVV